jgi:ribosomal protein S18 acetylase RimI-like enzyme
MAAVKAADVLIRVAGPGEFAVIGELTVAAYADGGALSLGAADPYADVLRDAASRPPETTVFLATDPAGAADSADPGRALGAVTYIPPGSPMAQVAHGQEAEIRMLAVAPDRRGRGIATALIRAAMDLARHEGRPALALCVISTNAGARALYERLGFARIPDRDRSLGPTIVLLAYRLPLS